MMYSRMLSAMHTSHFSKDEEIYAGFILKVQEGNINSIFSGDGSATQPAHVILIVHLRSGCDGHGCTNLW